MTTPCPVCGLIDECPHTPVRCKHVWEYGPTENGPFTLWGPGGSVPSGACRRCGDCGRIERSILSWYTVKA